MNLFDINYRRIMIYHLFEVTLRVLYFLFGPRETVNQPPAPVGVFSCNSTWLRGEVKSYLEMEDVRDVMCKHDILQQWPNYYYHVSPQRIWSNFLKIENPCESDEARFLQIYCGNRHQINKDIFDEWLWEATFGYLFGRRKSLTHLRDWYSWNRLSIDDAVIKYGEGIHFCSRIPRIPNGETELKMDVEDLDRLIARIIGKPLELSSSPLAEEDLYEKPQLRFCPFSKDEIVDYTELLEYFKA